MNKIDNLPVIQQALGDAWEELDSIVRLHYDITPGTSARIIMQGTMQEIHHSLVAKLFLLPGLLFGALIPWRGKNILTTVHNWTTDNNHKTMFWHRTFQFPGRKDVVFESRMEYIGGTEIIEYVRYGLGIRMQLSVESGSLVYRSTGYQWDIGGLSIRFPTWLILGKGEISESGISETAFEMDFQMTHPLLGRTFAYSGKFSIESVETQHGTLTTPLAPQNSA